MLGVVLCGGQSTRMTRDKGLLTSKENSWANIAADKLKTQTLQIAISINPSQLDTYSHIFPADQLVIDNEGLQIKGPLLGLLSVHLRYPAEDLLILACDMPKMETDILSKLVEFYHKENTPDSYVYTNNGEPEPLCGIYTARGLADIMHLAQSGQLAKHSMKYMLEHINTFSIPIPENRAACFQNFNSHAELNGL